MLAGSEGPGGISFDNPGLAKALGVTALVLILFAGGLDTHWKSIKPVLAPGISLATVGVVVTAALVGLFSHFVLHFQMHESLLLGAIVSSTDAAAVFGVLRAQKMRLSPKMVPLLELESGSNDPVAVFLTIGMVQIILHPELGVSHLLPELLYEMAMGVVGGYCIARAAAEVINRVHLDYDGLYPVFTIGIAALSYAAVELLGGNGFLSCYVAGVTLGSRRVIHQVALLQFHEALSWLMQIAMFLCLGLLVFPSRLAPEAWDSIGLAFFLILVARPIAVMLSLLPFHDIPWNEKFFVGWVGLRGAVPIVLATIPLTSGVPGAERIFNSVFFIVLLSVLVQGVNIRRVASYLGVIEKEPLQIVEKRIAASLIEVSIPKTSHVVGRSVVELDLPEGTLLVLVSRGRENIIPRGGTVLQADDKILIQSQNGEMDRLKEFFSAAK
jgi:cell volume regulation protein A